MKINGLILAAGNSSRLGQPKQLIKYHGHTLLASIEEHLLSCCDQVYVVLGYQAELIGQTLSTAEIIINPNWQVGMGNSLACGAKIAGHQADGLLVALSDQPKINALHYQKLVNQFNQTPEKITASHYQKSSGVPAIFPTRLLNYLFLLEGKTGAQSIFKNHPNEVIKISCPAANFDIDTAEDLAALL